MVYVMFRVRKIEGALISVRRQQGTQLSIDDVTRIVQEETETAAGETETAAGETETAAVETEDDVVDVVESSNDVAAETADCVDEEQPTDTSAVVPQPAPALNLPSPASIAVA